MEAKVLKIKTTDPPTPEQDDMIDESLIRRRAYEIWQSRGGPASGSDVDDWFMAQQELAPKQ